jgi:hypothetical protein
MRKSSIHILLRSGKIDAAAKDQTEAPNVSDMLRQCGRSFLSSLKKKSIRANNSWYRLLGLDKRRLIEAVIQTVDKIKSSLLLKILTPLVERLLQALGGIPGFMGILAYGMLSYGQSHAKRVSRVAFEWGNSLAAQWADDKGFIRFLTIMDINSHPTN